MARRQDQGAFSELFETYAPKIKGMLIHRGASSDRAEELTQECFYRVWKRCHGFDPERGRASSWIYTIARNVFIDSVRKERHFLIDDSVQAEREADMQGQEMSPREHHEAKERGIQLKVALDALPPEQAHVVERAYLGGDTFAALAESSGLPIGTIKSRARLAMARLRTLLEGRDT